MQGKETPTHNRIRLKDDYRKVIETSRVFDVPTKLESREIFSPLLTPEKTFCLLLVMLVSQVSEIKHTSPSINHSFITSPLRLHKQLS